MNFQWERVGRQYVARIGKLHVCVRILGSERRGDVRYLVGDIFGNSFLDMNNTPPAHLEEAQARAEALALREMQAIAKLVRP